MEELQLKPYPTRLPQGVITKAFTALVANLRKVLRANIESHGVTYLKRYANTESHGVTESPGLHILT